MRIFHALFLIPIVCAPLGACAYKSRLKTPAQIEKEEAKKAKKKEAPAVEITTPEEPKAAE